MWANFLSWFKTKSIIILLYLILGIIAANSMLVIYYRDVIIENSELKEKIISINNGLEFMNRNVNLADLGLRGFLIYPEEQLLSPFVQSYESYQSNLDTLKINLESVGYDVELMNPALLSIKQYMNEAQRMVDKCKQGQAEEVVEWLKQDRGYDAWVIYGKFDANAQSFVNDLTVTAKQRYDKLISQMIFMQLIFLVVGIPILLATIRVIRKGRKFRANLFRDLEQNNKKYIFNNGEKETEQDEEMIISDLITNLKKTASFIKKIAKGDYDIEWKGLGPKNQSLNEGNIAGELVDMRDQMRQVKEDDERRLWITQGISDFAGIIRNHQADFYKLSEQFIVNLVRYLDVQLGGIFILNEENSADTFLELTGCYAFDRVKTMENRVDLEQGLIGQCYKEQQTIYMSDVPQDFVNITSGLGEIRPSYILLVPLIYNEKIVGVVELASLESFEKHKIEFVEKIGESIASAVLTARNAQKTRVLLEKTQEQAEQVRAQEEEMRQNLEELQATQEQMSRKNEEVELLLEKSAKSEAELKEKMALMEQLEKESSRLAAKMKEESEGFKVMLTEILDELPQKIFVKDSEGKIYLANKQVAKTHGMSVQDLLGKSDYDFVDKKTADQWRSQELAIIKKGSERYVFEEKIGSKTRVIESIKKSFYINPLGEKGLLGIQQEITDEEEKARKLQENGQSV